MRLLSSLATLVLISVPVAASATPIFYDNFGSATPGLGVQGMIDSNFSVTSGNVDVLGPNGGNYGNLCSGGGTGGQQCIDMGGTDEGGMNTNTQGVLTSNTTYGPGKYYFTFYLTGDGRGGTDSVLVTFGTYSQMVTLTSADKTDGKYGVFVDLTSASGIQFADQAPGNQSLILNYVSLATTPEPSSLALLGTGLLAIAFTMRRRLAL